MADATLYLFDGYNLVHTGGLAGRQELVDRLAGFVAVEGARGIVVFDGEGADEEIGALEVRFALSADRLLERLAAERRRNERVVLVSTDRAVRDTAGIEVRKLSSAEFLAGLGEVPRLPGRPAGGKVEDALEDETRRRLEEWRRKRP